MARIAIIGASGMLGYDLLRAAQAGDTAIGLSHEDVEITDPESVRAALEGAKPDVVINTAAITKTELCEVEPERAFTVNAVGVYHVAKAARELGAAIVYISTDYVFDGAKPSFSEDDEPRPLNVYGAAKLAGEHLTRLANPRYYIARTGWLFGKNVSHKGYNFVTLMLDKAKSQSEVRVVNDQHGTPTYTLDLATKIYELIQRRAPFGTYHITNQGDATWYEFAKAIFELSGMNPKLIPIATAESGSKIRRPPFSVLENTKLGELGIEPLRPWPEALRVYLDEIH